jgi:hypothetical protein
LGSLGRSIGGLAAVLVCVALVPTAVDAASSPRESLNAILTAARAQRSVHYVAIATNGVSRTRLVCDVATASGIQRITYSIGGRTGKVTVLVDSGTAFIRGDSFVLSTYLGFRAPASAKYANTWIRVPRTDRAYGAISAAVTLPSTIDELRLAGPLSFLPQKTVAGQKVTGIKGTIGRPAAQAALYARAHGTPLPVGEVETFGKALDETLFSHWNEAVHLQVPARAVPIATTGLE